MRSEPTPPWMLEALREHPLYHVCWRRYLLRDHVCQGRITTEHAITHAGRRVNELWALVRICAWAHEVDQFQDGGGMIKNINRWIAFGRITNWEEVERKYPRTTWRQDFRYLTGLYGHSRVPDER